MHTNKRDMPYPLQTVISRFVATCQADERVAAAFLGGSQSSDLHSSTKLLTSVLRGATDEFRNVARFA